MVVAQTVGAHEELIKLTIVKIMNSGCMNYFGGIFQ